MDADFQVLITRLESNDPTLTKINLKNKNIGDAGLITLSQAMKGNTFLKVLDLGGNNIGPKGAYFKYNLFRPTSLVSFCFVLRYILV